MRHECPRCGITDGAVVTAVLDEYGRRLPVVCCGSCGRHDVDWSHPINDENTVFVVLRQCPHCGSSDTTTEHTRARKQVVRYHRCRACELPFRSIELGGVPIIGTSI